MSNIQCCFCGKEIDESKSHDIRPIITNKGDRCCRNCNANIVIPTRGKVWGKIVYAFRDSQGNYYKNESDNKYFYVDSLAEAEWMQKNTQMSNYDIVQLEVWEECIYGNNGRLPETDK